MMFESPTNLTPKLSLASALLVVLICCLASVSCGEDEAKTETKTATPPQDQEETPQPKTAEPQAKKSGYVPPPAGTQQDKIAHAQHIIIAFKGTKMADLAQRSQAEAKVLAKKVLELAQTSDDFTALVLKYSDDPARGDNKGRSRIANFNQAIDKIGGALPRQAVPGVGDVLFKLKVGEVGFVPYDEKKSPVGYWIIKRTK